MRKINYSKFSLVSVRIYVTSALSSKCPSTV